MNTMMQHSVKVALQKLAQYGFQDCTEVTSRQNGINYFYAFERLNEQKSVPYCCLTVEDLFALVSLVEASAASESALP